MTELARWRKKQGWSQEKLAKKLGYGDRWTTYAAQERGENGLPEPVVSKLRELGFQGELPQEEDQEPDITDELAELRAALKAHVDYWTRGEEKVLQELRDMVQRIAVLEDRVGIRR